MPVLSHLYTSDRLQVRLCAPSIQKTSLIRAERRAKPSTEVPGDQPLDGRGATVEDGDRFWTPASAVTVRPAFLGKACPVLRLPCIFRHRRAAHWLMVALLVIGGLTGTACNTAAAGSEASLTPGAGHSEGQKGHHRCKCALRCRGGSCCCGPGHATVVPPTSASAQRRATPAAIGGETGVGPCLEAAPCGGAVPTTPSLILRMADTAALLAGLPFPAAIAGQRLAPCLSDRPIPIEPSRLDEPPEHVGFL